ncbi:MAG: restriction endonuclease, partial [Saonia sp.]
MPSSNVSLPKPKDWQDFERKTRDLIKFHLDDPRTQLNGRGGQPQCGVDVYGCRDRKTREWVAVQCKKSEDQITKTELVKELEDAKGFEPAISEFILVTTAPRDAKIQKEARLLTEELADSERPIVVSVWGWEDIEERASEDADVWRSFDPNINPFVDQLG